MFGRGIKLFTIFGNSRMMVTKGNELVGIIASKDMLEFLSLKIDLEEAG